jgi:hypothetical protein
MGCDSSWFDPSISAYAIMCDNSERITLLKTMNSVAEGIYHIYMKLYTIQTCLSNEKS